MIVDTMTGDNSDTTLTLSVAPVSENNVQVYFDGVYQSKANYSTSGTTLTFSTAPATGVAVEAISFTQTSVNAPTNDSVATATIQDGAVTAAKLASGVGGVAGIVSSADATAITIDSSENVGIGTTNPSSGGGLLNLETSSSSVVNYNSTNANGGYIKFQRSGTTKGYVGTPAGFLGGGDADDLGIRAQADFTVATGGANERFRITSDGRGVSQFTAHAWVNFNGQNTVAIQDSYNVSSITDGGTGFYTVNFSNNTNADHSTVVSGNNYDVHLSCRNQLAGSVQVNSYSFSTSSLQDISSVKVVTFGG